MASCSTFVFLFFLISGHYLNKLKFHCTNCVRFWFYCFCTCCCFLIIYLLHCLWPVIFPLCNAWRAFNNVFFCLLNWSYKVVHMKWDFCFYNFVCTIFSPHDYGWFIRRYLRIIRRGGQMQTFYLSIKMCAILFRSD